MKSRIQKWGHSLALRIRKSFALEAGLDENAAVELTLVDGKLVVTPHPEPVSLDALLAGITPANRHDEKDVGGPIGREVWQACRLCRLAAMLSGSP